MTTYHEYDGIGASRRPLRIAQVAPLYESVPPKRYGGTERVVACLTEALTRRGHEVTLFASGDSAASARLRSTRRGSLREEGLTPLGASLQLPLLSEVFDHAGSFDVIHCHLDYWSFPFAHLVRTPVLTTLHGRMDIKELFEVYRYYADAPVVSISHAQRRPMPELNWVATVYHGLTGDRLHFSSGPGRYLAFLGRISPEKRPDLAIEVARRARIPLKIAAKVDDADRGYYESVIKPMLDGPGVEFIGEIGEDQKSEFLGNAIALLFPVDWPEPFGLVMIEALACGTPVIARPFGSVPEILRDGVTGIIASTVEEMADAVRRIGALSRHRCRQEFEARFTAEVMARNYERVYHELIEDRRGAAAPLDHPARGLTERTGAGEGRRRWPLDLETA